MFGALALVVGIFAAEAAALRQWRGGWQMAALVPAAIVFVVIVRILADALHDPTSHNLWPFEICIWSGVALVALGLLAGARALTAPRGQP